MSDDRTTVNVWDRFVRVFHWTLVASFAIAYFSTEHIGLLHKGAGYLALGLVAARAVWGFVAPSRHARFAHFVPTPARLLRYLTLLLRGREPRHLGHNPADAVMILYLMSATLVIGVTGFLMTTEAYGGNELVETLHTTAVDLTLVAIAVHVGANAYESLQHRENLFKAMVTGRKRTPAAEEHAEAYDSFMDGWDDTQPSEPAALQPPPRTHRI